MNGQDVYERLARTRQELMMFGCHELEKEVIETDPESRISLLNLLARYDARPKDDPIIAVSTWKEVNHPEVAKRLLEGSYSIVVADEAENFEESIEDDDRLVFRGPVIKHMSKILSRLEASLEGATFAKKSEKNLARRSKAEKFAEYMWPYIEAIAEEWKTSNQTEIAKRLTDSGLKPVEGEVIQQAHVSRYISRARKQKEWKAFQKTLTFKETPKEPDLFDTLKQEGDPESR